MVKKRSNFAKANNTPTFLTRNQAIKKLQLNLPQFRRLCILKGIHPRDPRKKPKGQGKTYYHIKDIMFLAHEPLLKKFREIVAYDRKVRRARAKLNNDLARRLLRRKPTYSLDHLVRERYPSFLDALRDLDDALTLVHLFAMLPAERRFRIPNAVVQTSRRLALEWQAYIVKTSSLRKVFIAVKGFYFQAEVLGQTITWLVPHQLSQVLPEDIDYKIMMSFLEFYQTLLQFVNFKLYHIIGVNYPPIVDPRLEQAAAGLAAIMKDLSDPAADQSFPRQPAGPDEPLGAEATLRLEGLQDRLRQIQEEAAKETEAAEGNTPETAPASGVGPEESGSSEDDDDDAQIDSGDDDVVVDADKEADKTPGAALATPEGTASGGPGEGVSEVLGGARESDDDASVCATLFRGLVFYLGREVPREHLLVVIRAFGGHVGWDGEESPLSESDPSITHQVFDRPALSQQLADREYVQPQWIVDSANFRVLVDARLYGPGKTLPPHLSPFVNNEEEGYVPEYAAVLQKMQESARITRKRALGLITEADFLREEAEAKESNAGPDAAEQLYSAELAKELKGKRKAEADPEVDEEEEKAGALPDHPTASSGGNLPATGNDEEMMNKSIMKRKDRHLYQSILNRQKKQQEVAATLKKKRARLASES